MVRIGRNKGERIIIYADDPSIAKLLGDSQVEIIVKKSDQRNRAKCFLQSPLQRVFRF